MVRSLQNLDIQRWKTGHRSFFVIIQTMIIAIQRFAEAPSSERLDEVTSLLAGAGAMMEYSADFVSGDYTDVRDSMAELDPDFSGTFSADHAEMIRHFALLKPFNEQFPAAFKTFQLTLEQVYAAHAFICRRFVGEGGSLANDKRPAWRIVYSKLSKRALAKAGISNSRMPHKYSVNAET